jgi:spore coat protein SA
LSYDIAEKIGLGGGKQALLNLSKSLSVFCPVELICNCVPYEKTNLKFIPISNYSPSETDLLIITTSSLMDIRNLPLPTALAKCLWIHGISPIKGVKQIEFDFYVTVSHFLKYYWHHKHKLPWGKIHTIHLGVQNDVSYASSEKLPYSVAYASHPTKGLDRVIRLVRNLRTDGYPFDLHIYGGYELWDSKSTKKIEFDDNFIFYHGNLPSVQLDTELRKYSFGVQITDISEGFGLVILQYLKNGMVPIVSDVGAVSEIIRHGYNGFLIDGSFEEQVEQAEHIIKSLVQKPNVLEEIRNNIKASRIRTWDCVALEFLNLYRAIAMHSTSLK